MVASGDSMQFVHGDRITAETIFHFKDGSVDDETTVYTQHRTFHLISDHHMQKGPSFPHPMDVLIDAAERHGDDACIERAGQGWEGGGEDAST